MWDSFEVWSLKVEEEQKERDRFIELISEWIELIAASFLCIIENEDE